MTDAEAPAASPEAAPIDEKDGPGEPEVAAPSPRPPAAGATRGRVRRVWNHLVDAYGTADPRSLGVFRIALGVLLFLDLARRYPDLLDHFSNAGWLPNHFAIYRPMSSHLFSVYLAFGSPGEVEVLFWVHLGIISLFLIGWHTRLMHALAAVLLISINSRNILLENGGWVVLILLTVWTLFLPLGRRFSVDAWLLSFRESRETDVAALNDRSGPTPARVPVRGLAVTALILQWAAIYYFNTVHKNGAPWHDGTAVYYFFEQDRMLSAFGGWVRHFVPLAAMKGMTWGTLVMEGTICVLLLVPFARRWTRKLATVLIIMLHLGIDLVVQLGPFSWAMMLPGLIFLHRDDWAWYKRRLQARRRPLEVMLDEKDGFSLQIGRALKRLDRLELLTFSPLPEGAAAPFLVVDGDEKLVGRAAGRRLFDALPLPRWLRVVCYLPAPSLRERGQWSRRLGLNGLPQVGGFQASVPSGAVRSFRRLGWLAAQLCVVVLMVGAVSQVLMENRAIPKALKLKKRPEWMTAMVIYPRMFQGWSMFAPRPPDYDNKLVVDAVTVDGRHIDPLSGRAPDWEMNPKEGFLMSQIWGDFHRRIGEGRFRQYRPGVRDYLKRYHERTGQKNDRLVAFDAWMVTEKIPLPGKPRLPPRREKIIGFGRVKEPVAWPHGGVGPKPKSAPAVRRSPLTPGAVRQLKGLAPKASGH